jgi:hypothetical protein
MTSDPILARLRAANPHRPAPAGGAEALFERIVSEPRAPGGGRRRRAPRRGLVLALGVLAAAVAASAALGVHFAGWFGGDVVRAPVSHSEYLQAQKLLTLPPGYTWPSIHFRSDSVMNRGAGGSFAVSIDQSAWECYWAAAIRSGDTSGGARAQAVLADLMRHRTLVAPKDASENWSPPAGTPWPVQVFADDGGYQYKERIYREAAAGDPALLEQSCRANRP